MPTVLRRDGFLVLVLNPPREHGPAHVHVVKAEGEVLINLPLKGATLSIREIRGMRRSDVAKAFVIVAENVQLCCDTWEEIHGKD